MFSKRFSSSISLATVTPSFVTVGEPKLFSMTTLRPLGPRVTLTASASALTPARIRLRACSVYTISLAAMISSPLLLDDAEDVVLAQNEVLFAVDLHFSTRVLAEQDGIAGFHIELTDSAVFEDFAVTHGHNLALDGLLFGRIGDDDAPLALLFFLEPLDDDAVLQRSNCHVGRSL